MALSPLQPNAPIVDESGRPTLVFLRQWEEIRRLLGEIEGIAGTYGAEDKAVRITINSRGQIIAVEEVPIVP